MSEYMSPIPSRIYNAAVGGHVAGADQIIDDETGLTLDKVAGGALEEKTYTSGSNNGMGRVVLRKNLVNEVNTLTQSMINKSNTIYVIQYDFTLGEDITIPANCVLEFDGGSISGTATLTFNDTQLTGVYGGLKHSVGLSGTIKGAVDVGFWDIKYDDESYDNGVIINKVASVFHNLFINAGTLYYSTPSVIRGAESYRSLADFVYCGTNGKKSTFTFAVCRAANIDLIGSISCKSGIVDFNTVDYGIDATHGLIGLTFENIKQSMVSVVSVEGFNEGIRISSDYDASMNYYYNSNNIYTIVAVNNNNVGIRIYQDNRGYCNENMIFGGHFFVSSSAAIQKKMAILLAGPKYENPSNTTDVYDSVNGLSFQKMNVESYSGMPYVAYGRNVISCRFEMIRGEVESVFANFISDSQNNVIDIQYKTNKYKGDFVFSNTVSRIPVKLNAPILLKELKLSSLCKSVPAGSYRTWSVFDYSMFDGDTFRTYIAQSEGVVPTGVFSGYIPSVVIDTSKCKLIRCKTDAERSYIYVTYKTYEGSLSSIPAPLGNYKVTTDAVYGFKNANPATTDIYFCIPDEVKEIYVSFEAIVNSALIFGEEYANVSFIEYKPKGATGERETHPHDGSMFYNETTHKQQIFNLDTVTWSDIATV